MGHSGMRSERRQRTDLVALRLLPDEHQAVRDAATDLGVSVSELVRSSVLNKIGYFKGKALRPAPEEATG